MVFKNQNLLTFLAFPQQEDLVAIVIRIVTKEIDLIPGHIENDTGIGVFGRRWTGRPVEIKKSGINGLSFSAVHYREYNGIPFPSRSISFGSVGWEREMRAWGQILRKRT